MRNVTIIIAAFFAMMAQPAMASEIGRIKNVTAGGIEVVRDGTKLIGRSGFKLREGDIVVTTARQRAGITFIDDTRIVVAPGSRMIISRYRFDRARRTGESSMQIQRGKVGVDTGQLSKTGRMKFRTPTSTLGVRGTTFVIEVDE